ncbi:MAG: lytic murein transglycosylase [Pseudomonadota bacterium]
MQDRPQTPAQSDIAAVMEGLRSRAASAGVSEKTFQAANRDLEPDREVVARYTQQPEFEKTPGQYIAQLASNARAAEGRRKLADAVELFDAIEADYGVPRVVLAAIWGIESNFGAQMGESRVIRSLATLAAIKDRRAEFWTDQLLAALDIAEQERFAPNDLTGSWAGAMGHTQFMPRTYLAHAVDFDRDGQRDIWTSIADALASAAALLAHSGWIADVDWGVEAHLLASFDLTRTDPWRAAPLSEWRVRGIEPVGSDRRIADDLKLRLILPEGVSAPAFLVSSNFDMILTYNRAQSYALAVGHLSDRISGRPPLSRAWRPPEDALDRAGRVALQEYLSALGWDTGGVDGIIGPKTRSAIRAFQLRERIVGDGYATTDVLNRARQAASNLKSD